VLGECTNALSKQAARMLAAANALEGWDDFLKAHQEQQRRKEQARQEADAAVEAVAKANSLAEVETLGPVSRRHKEQSSSADGKVV